MPDWLIFQHKVPSEPSASRVYIWRKLKRLGALLSQDALWVLPDSPRNLEQFQWLAAEVDELGGEAALWIARPALTGQDEGLIRQFIGQADNAYQELMDALQQPDINLEDLSRRYQSIKARDYFGSEIGKKLRKALLEVRGGEG